MGVPPQAGSGCQPTASAAEEASSRSGIPNAAFTPGPWTAEQYHDNEWQIDAARDAVATTAFCFAPESTANARLIAAAPELYEAARLFVEEYDAADQDDGVAMMLAYNAALEAAKAALAKARGEP
jgi:hypothetical protein